MGITYQISRAIIEPYENLAATAFRVCRLGLDPTSKSREYKTKIKTAA